MNMKSLCILFFLLLTVAGPVAADPTAAGPVDNASRVSLSPAEAEWLNAHPRIRLGLFDGIEPAMFRGKNGEFVGIVTEIIDLIGRRAGIQFEIVPITASMRSDLLNQMKAGEIDLYPGFKNPAHGELLRFTAPFYTVSWVIVGRDDTPFISGLRDLEALDLTVAIVRNMKWDEILSQHYPDIDVVHAETVLESLNLVSHGKADAVVIGLDIAAYLIRKHGLYNLKVAAPMDYPASATCLAVRKDLPELAAILDKAIASLDRRELDVIIQKWLPVRFEHGVDIDYVVKMVAMIVLGCLVLLAGFFFWNRRLAREVTERKRVEKALLKAQDLLNETGKMAHVGGWELDVATRRLVWTREVYRIHEVPADFEPTVEQGIGFYAPEWQSVISQAVRHSIESGEPFDVELEIITAKEHRRWVHCIGRPRLENGKTVKVGGTFQDITERKRAEAALTESEEKYRVLFQSFPVGVTVSDEHGNILETNHFSEKLLGVSRPEHEGRRINGGEWAIIRPNGTVMPAEEWASVRALKEKRLISNMEMGIRRPDGQEIWISVTAAPVPLKHYGVIVIYVDITGRIQAEMKLQQYSQHLEEMVEARTRELQTAHDELLVKERLAVLGHFSGNISHELRNPLAVIDSAAYILKRRLAAEDDKIQHYLKNIRDNVQKATDIIESLLSLSRMEKPKTNPQDLAGLIQDAAHGGRIPETVKVVTDMPKAPVSVPVDSEQIRMALKNIITNAVQAMGGEGELTVSARVTDDDRAELTISDTGPGIPADQLEKIFEPLFTTKAKGIGFGLAITKMIVDNHGGMVRAETAPGGGARFVIMLPRVAK
jgi:PAS domain S-box-containing protein